MLSYLENLAYIVSSSRQKSSGRHLRFSHINARSVCNKLNDLHQYINLNNIDLCAITETWIGSRMTSMKRSLDQMATNASPSPIGNAWEVVLYLFTGTTSQ